jgi:hypothetical protein
MEARCWEMEGALARSQATFALPNCIRKCSAKARHRAKRSAPRFARACQWVLVDAPSWHARLTPGATGAACLHSCGVAGCPNRQFFQGACRRICQRAAGAEATLRFERQDEPCALARHSGRSPPSRSSMEIPGTQREHRTRARAGICPTFCVCGAGVPPVGNRDPGAARCGRTAA